MNEKNNLKQSLLSHEDRVNYQIRKDFDVEINILTIT
jgi:hypothetical protein